MAKKTQLSDESIGAFPKIASKCSIKQCTLKKGSKDLRLDNFSVSRGQTELLKGLINTAEPVLVTISPIQGRLAGT